MKTAIGGRRALAVAGLAIALVFSASGDARAQYRRAAMNAARQQQRAQTQATAQQANLQVINALHQVEMTLAQADRDYDGRRVKAMQEIGGAIRALEPPAVRKNQGGANPGGAYVANRNGAEAGTAGGGKGKGGAGSGSGANGKQKMPQAASDAQLQTALQALTQIESQLATSNQPHHVRALAQLRKASEHLRVALKIR
jgi:cellobiose-specific phosphotransferase system component IIA